jgi:hypothetical protein
MHGAYSRMKKERCWLYRRIVFTTHDKNDPDKQLIDCMQVQYLRVVVLDGHMVLIMLCPFSSRTCPIFKL